MMLRGRSAFLLRDRQGSILVVTCWVLLILEIFTVSAGFQVRQKIALAERLDRRNLLFGLAEAGVYQALVLLRQEYPPPASNHLNESWSSHELLFRNVPVSQEGSFSVSYDYLDYKESADGVWKTRYGSQDEESKLNLNTVKPEILRDLLRNVADLDEDQASQIAHSVVDWRDPDSLQSQAAYGAEDDYYEDLEFPYEAKDAPFEVLHEVLLVRGMTPEIFKQIQEKITIYGTGAVNINTASKEVLIALGLSEQLAETVLAYRRGIDHEEATEDDRAFTQAASITAELSRVYPGLGAEPGLLSNLVASGLVSTISSHFMVRSLGQAKGTVLEMRAVINREGKILFSSVGIPRRIQMAAQKV